MTTALTPDVDTLRARLEEVDQAHLLAFYDELEPGQQQALLHSISALELEKLPAYVERYVTNPPEAQAPAELAPAPLYAFDGTIDGGGNWDREKARAQGEAIIRAGKVAAFTVAGGQGSRLGFDGPKGKYPAGAVTKKPLFQLFAEEILASRTKYQVAIPWYVMTSPINHEETVAFFEEHRYFGLPEDDVMFFSQGVMPSLDKETGKVLLAEKHAVATNPDGHGGSLKALATSGAIDDMHRRGIDHISYFQVDNPLVRAIDPVFIGLHAHAEHSSGEVSTKVVRKTDPAEKVGILALAGGRISVIEYSDLPAELATALAPGGTLLYSAGNIAIHLISVDFVSRLNAGGDFNLPFHRAIKKVACVDLDSGNAVSPDEPNAVKLETFVFDALPLADKSLVLETDRVEEFAPIKNAQGNDSAETSTLLQTERAARWLRAAGVEVPRKEDGAPDCTLEIAATTALGPGDLAGKDLPEAIERGSTLAL